MAGCSKKQYAIMMSAGPEGKKLASEMGGMEQDKFNEAFSELLGSGAYKPGEGEEAYSREKDEDYADFDANSEDDYGFDEEDDDEYDFSDSTNKSLLADIAHKKYGNRVIRQTLEDFVKEAKARGMSAQEVLASYYYGVEQNIPRDEWHFIFEDDFGPYPEDDDGNDEDDINRASSRRLDLIRTNPNLKVLNSLSDEQLEPFVDEILSMPEVKDTKQMAQMIRENPNLRVLKGLDDSQIKAVVEEIQSMPMKDEDDEYNREMQKAQEENAAMSENEPVEPKEQNVSKEDEFKKKDIEKYVKKYQEKYPDVAKEKIEKAVEDNYGFFTPVDTLEKKIDDALKNESNKSETEEDFNKRHQEFLEKGKGTWNQKLQKGDKVIVEGKDGKDIEAYVGGFWKNGEAIDEDTYEEGTDNHWHDFRGLKLVDKDGKHIGNINAFQIKSHSRNVSNDDIDAEIDRISENEVEKYLYKHFIELSKQYESRLSLAEHIADKLGIRMSEAYRQMADWLDSKKYLR